MKILNRCILLLLISYASIAQTQLQKKYDRATFTVIPTISTINDTLARDTLYSWENLPYSSFLLSEVSQNFVKADFKTSEKFYYNHTSIPENNPLKITKIDTVEFENLFGKKLLTGTYDRKKFKYYAPPKYHSIPSYSTELHPYGTWLKTKLENSPIPGEMMILWTNENILISRSAGNIDFDDLKRGKNSTSFNYYKKLLEKNYIVVQNVIDAQKLIVKPEILKAEQEAKELAEKNKSFIRKTTDFVKNMKESNKKNKQLKKDKKEGYYINPYKIDSNVYDKNRLTTSQTSFLKSYVYRIVLTDGLMSDLSSYPPIQPKTAKLEFVCSINSAPFSMGKSNRIKALEQRNVVQKIDIISNVKKSIKGIAIKTQDLSPRYIAGKEAIQKQIEIGEYLCAKNIIEQLKQYKNAETSFLDSLYVICTSELTKNPKINQKAFKNASKIQQNKPENFAYQVNCENFENIEMTPGYATSQESFDKIVGILEKKIKDFQILTSAEVVVKNKIEVNLDKKQSIYMGQQYKIVERSINKDGQKFDNRIGTARIIKVSDNLYSSDTLLNRTKLAQIDGKKIGKGALLIQDEVKGIAAYGGFGYRYHDYAFIIGADFSVKKLAQLPGFKVGINYITNTNETSGYTPSFVNLSLAKDMYFSRIFDIQPFVEVGYGGDLQNEYPVKRSVLLSAGTRVPFNLYNRKSSTKLKIVPELSFSTQKLSPQLCIISKIEF